MFLLLDCLLTPPYRVVLFTYVIYLDIMFYSVTVETYDCSDYESSPTLSGWTEYFDNLLDLSSYCFEMGQRFTPDPDITTSIYSVQTLDSLPLNARLYGDTRGDYREHSELIPF